MPGTVSAPKARRWPATEEAMHSRELVSTLARAEKAFHQLVGDVIVLGQQLPGQIERDRVRAVAVDDGAKAGRDLVERRIPGDARKRTIVLPQHRVQQAPIERQRLAKRRTLGAQPSEIGRMERIARDRRAAIAVRHRQHAAADAAIRAGGAHGLRMGRQSVHADLPRVVRLQAARRSASARPKIRSSRKSSIAAPERMRSRYQSASVGIAVEHGAGETAVGDDELPVAAEALIAEDDVLGAGSAEKIAGREHVDAGDFQIGGVDAAAVAQRRVRRGARQARGPARWQARPGRSRRRGVRRIRRSRIRPAVVVAR